MDGSSLTYASPKDWLDIMKNRSKVRMHELIERLGLRAKWSSNKRGKTNFESVLVRELVADMGEIVATLPKEPDELMRFLSADGSMRKEVDDLLERHGSKVWGRVGDREHLLTANEPGVDDGIYPRDLYYENEDDRALLHIFLHWWIGLKACNVILARERLDRERRKKAETRQARADAEQAGQHGEGGVPASFVALAPNSLRNDIDSTSRGSPMSSAAMLTPPESGGSPIMGPREGVEFLESNDREATHGGASISDLVNSRLSRAEQRPKDGADGVSNRFAARDRHAPKETISSWRPTNSMSKEVNMAVQQQEAVGRQISAGVSKLVARFPLGDTAFENVSPPSNSRPYRGLDYELLKTLRSYVYNVESSLDIDEEELLNQLERVWREDVRGDYDKIVDNVPVFIARERAFLTWIELKRHVAAFERAEERWSNEENTPEAEDRRHQQYRTLLGATEMIIKNFDDIGQGIGLGPEIVSNRDELLRQALVTLAGDKYAVELQWGSVEYEETVKWLIPALETFRKEEEEESSHTLCYME